MSEYVQDWSAEQHTEPHCWASGQHEPSGAGTLQHAPPMQVPPSSHGPDGFHSPQASGHSINDTESTTTSSDVLAAHARVADSTHSLRQLESVSPSGPYSVVVTSQRPTRAVQVQHGLRIGASVSSLKHPKAGRARSTHDLVLRTHSFGSSVDPRGRTSVFRDTDQIIRQYRIDAC